MNFRGVANVLQDRGSADCQARTAGLRSVRPQQVQLEAVSGCQALASSGLCAKAWTPSLDPYCKLRIM